VDKKLLKNLIKYYTEIVERDSLSKISFPSFKQGEDFVSICNSLNQEYSTIDKDIKLKRETKFFKQLTLTSNASSVYYGWPTFARIANTKSGKQYSWIEPIFLLKGEYSPTDSKITLIKEYPRLNDAILSSLTDTQEEKLQIIEELGINELEELDENGLIPIWEKLISLFPGLVLAEPIGKSDLVKRDFNNIEKTAVYNSSTLILASSPRYSRALLRELKLLNDNNTLSKAKDTSMEAVLFSKNEKRKSSSKISQISQLNKSQRNAVTNAFSNNLSVITGPPGTGKSQVVLNILSTAFEKGKSVLFSSKNNKAVDVVCERILEKIKFPLNLRLGSRTAERDYTTEFLDLLDSVLAGNVNKDEIFSRYTMDKNIHERIKKKYYSITNTLEKTAETRNKINQLDKDIGKLEKVISKKNITKLKKLKYKKSTSLKTANDEYDKLKHKHKWPLSKKIIGFFSIQLVYNDLHKYCVELNTIIGNVGSLPKETDEKIDPYGKFLKNFPTFHKFIHLYNKIQKESKKIPANNLKKLRNRVKETEKEFIQSSIDYIESLGKYRISILTQDEREALTSYHSLMRQLSGAYPGNQAYAKLKKQQATVFKKVMKILPVWSVTNLSAGNQFPIEANLFDLLVIDEASQSDIASALPMLYRSKNTVIIGDPQQLTHIASIGNNENNLLMNKYNLIEEKFLRFSYRDNSLFACARGSVGDDDNVTLLNEHYRSHFSIIEFSNQEWYEGNLEINTNYDNLFFPPEGRNFLEWINVKGNTIRPNNRSALNKIEGEKVLALLRKFHETYSDQGMTPSIGIVTPFNAQAKFFRDSIVEQYDESEIRENILIADTAHKFQGDERDIIIFSPVISQGVHNNSGTINFLQRTSNLFNVSVTRARSILWIVGDKSRCVDSGVGYLKNFVEWVEEKKFENIDLPYDGFQSPWEKKLFEVLTAKGFSPTKQEPAGPYFIDIALETDVCKLAIEVDGAYWHKDMNGNRLEKDLIRDSNLEAMGWKVLRFWVHDLKYYMSDCVKKINKEIIVK